MTGAGAEVNHQSRNVFPDQWLTFRLASPHHEDARIENSQTKASEGSWWDLSHGRTEGFIEWSSGTFKASMSWRINDIKHATSVVSITKRAALASLEVCAMTSQGERAATREQERSKPETTPRHPAAYARSETGPSCEQSRNVL